jgi:hypothetical protein
MTTCRCETQPLLVDAGMGSEDDTALETLELMVSHGAPRRWLSAERCSACGQWWLVAADERINDVYLRRRLTEAEIEALQSRREWPADFSTFAEVLRLGRERGHSVIFGDPESPALVDTVVDLAREEDGIRASRVAWLLQIDLGQTLRLADLAEAQASVRITRS